jgi:NMT1-like family
MSEKPSPVAIRSRVMLEMACEMVTMADQPMRQAKVLLRAQGIAEEADWPLRLFGSSTGEGVDAVVSGESAVGIINPSGALTVAYRGSRGLAAAPVRTVAVIPSYDQYVFAVHPRTGLSRLEEIAEQRMPLHISLRGQRDHCLHAMLDDILHAAGFSLADLQSWGGTISYEGLAPDFSHPKFARLIRGELDAVFDEGVYEWLPQVLAAGIMILPLAEQTVLRLEAMGYRRGTIERAIYPALPHDILTIDFSGWPIFVRADSPDPLVRHMCAALDARKHLIPWEGLGPLPLERMCRDAPDTPLDVPLHPAAERFWRERGYLEPLPSTGKA